MDEDSLLIEREFVGILERDYEQTASVRDTWLFHFQKHNHGEVWRNMSEGQSHAAALRFTSEVAEHFKSTEFRGDDYDGADTKRFRPSEELTRLVGMDSSDQMLGNIHSGQTA